MPIGSDSQATLPAVNKQDIESELILKCKTASKQLAKRNSATLMWVPNHTGFKGNEKANQLAKSDITSEYLGPEPVLEVVSCCIGISIKGWIRTKLREYWEQTQGCGQVKVILDYTQRIDRVRGNSRINQGRLQDIYSNVHRAQLLELSHAQNGVQPHD